MRNPRRLEVNEVYCSDCLDFMRRIPDGSVDLVIADYPFSYYYDKNMKKIVSGKKIGSFVKNTVNEFNRILVDDGNLAIFWQSIFAYKYLGFVSKLFKVRNIVVCVRSMRLSFVNLHFSYDMLILLCKGSRRKRFYRIKNLTDVWYDREKHRKYHREQISVLFVERVVKLLSKPNDLVFDPFVGGGNGVIVCYKMMRRFLGCDIDRKSVDITRKRLFLLRGKNEQ